MDIRQIQPSALSSIERQIIPAPYASLLTKKSSEELFLFAAYKDNGLAGLLIATGIKELHTAILHLVIVAEPFRHQGIASKLLLHLDAELKKHRFKSVTKQYEMTVPNAVYLEKALLKAKWQGTRLFSKKFVFESAIFSPKWFQRTYQLHSGLEAILWDKLSRKSLSLLTEKAKDDFNFPRELSPLRETEKIHKETSIALLEQEEIVGWMITHLDNAENLRYAYIYVEPRFQNTNAMVYILQKSIRRHIDLKIKWGIFDINLQQSSQSWIKFVEKRLAPYAQKVTQARQAWHLL